MGFVETALGRISSDQVGATLMHEHTIVHFAGAEFDYHRESISEQTPRVADHLQRAKAAGIATIVDAAPADLGRNVAINVELSRRTGVNIVCSTGQYSCFTVPHYASPYASFDADYLAENFVRELRVGIGDTGVKAGVIKVATGPEGVNDYSRRALLAAGIAQRETGVAVITHTDAGAGGLEQIEVLAEGGADLSRVVIGHNDTADLGYLAAIADAGAVLGIDRLSNEKFLPERLRMASLFALLSMGFEHQIVLSQDCAACMSHYQVGYLHIPETVVPALRRAGVTAETIEAMLVGTPRRVLAGD
jgi:phosphotriesterase-related protein